MKQLLIIGIAACLTLTAFTQEHMLFSPDNSICMFLNASEKGLEYRIEKHEKELVKTSGIAMTTNTFGASVFSEIIKIEENEGIDMFSLQWGTTSLIEESYKQVQLFFNSNVSVVFRAYNDGVAWRFETTNTDSVLVDSELCEFNLSNSSTIYFPQADGFSTPFEANYLPHSIDDRQDEKLGLTPLLVKTVEGYSLVLSEVNLKNYPGMFLNMNSRGLSATFPQYPTAEKEQFLGKMRMTNIPQLSKKMVSKTANYIAACSGENNFPWRAVLIANSDKDLLTNKLVACLADKPSENIDYSWVKPGKVVWDWYHKWNLDGVDFKPGINTATYHYMIDFAAKNNIEYVNIDDGWCGLHNFNKVNKNLDLNAVLSHAQEQNIGIFLWCTWQTLEEDLMANLDYFQSLGIAGLKVDFFDRCDQKVVDFVNLLGTECAKRKLLLNLHGMYKPTGLEVSYPNMVNFEGVLGLEYNKFSEKCTPTHNLTIPFARNSVGAMDYTPGAMRYMDSSDFKKSWSNPHAMSTRAQQMAMYVVYHGGIQMLADSPTLYEADSVALDFLSQVPVTWDESHALEAKLGQHVVIARRSGTTWYIAGINASQATNFNLDFSFLPKGTYKASLYQQGKHASILTKTHAKIKSDEVFGTELSPTSGFIIQLTKE